MLRMPAFKVLHPATIEEAVALYGAHNRAKYIAGGTDLLPNLKHGLGQPEVLISLKKIESMKGVQLRSDGSVFLGAGTTLHELTESKVLEKQYPGLHMAAGLVAGPQHRRMGTLGGNIMLDTRCVYYNQTAEWRHSLGYCLKAEGDWCHVIGSKATCVAANSSDTVPMLLAMNAELSVHTPSGAAHLPLEQLYQQNGMANHSIDPSALVVGIRLPPLPKGHRSIYRKVRARNSIDFPQLGVAITGTFTNNTVENLVVIVNAVMPKPKRIRNLEFAQGERLTEEVIRTISELAYKQVRPQPSVHGCPKWRREQVRVEVSRGLSVLRDEL